MNRYQIKISFPFPNYFLQLQVCRVITWKLLFPPYWNLIVASDTNNISSSSRKQVVSSNSKIFSYIILWLFCFFRYYLSSPQSNPRIKYYFSWRYNLTKRLFRYKLDVYLDVTCNPEWYFTHVFKHATSYIYALEFRDTHTILCSRGNYN